MSSSRLENFNRGLITLGLIVTTVLLAVYAYTRENYLMMFGMLGVAPAVALINNPSTFLVLIIATYNSGLILPGLPKGLQLWNLLMAGFVALILARNIVLKPSRERMPVSFIFIWGFLIVLGFLISQRGFGLLSSGGSLIGGASYVKVIVAAGFILCSRYIRLTTEQWKIAILGMIFGGLIPLMAQLLFMYSGGAIDFQFHFVQFYGGTMDSLNAIQTGTSVERIQMLGPVAQGALIFVLVFMTRTREFKLITFVGLAVCLGLAAMTGFRTMILEIVGVTLLYRLLQAAPRDRARIVLIAGAVTVFSILLLIPVTQHLPQAAQRALSWIPFAQIDPIAAQEARLSTEWRLDLWRYLWDRVPDYFWVGRGFAMNIDEIMAYSVMKSDILRFWADHNYHNGPLSMLLDTGLPGALFLTLFLIFAVWETLHPRHLPKDDFVYRFFVVMQAKVLHGVLSFFLVHGDVRQVLPSIFVNLAIVYGLQVTDIRLQKARAKRDFALVDPSFGSATPERPAGR